MFAAGFADGWKVMDSTLNAQQELRMRQQAMEQERAMQERQLAMREREFNTRSRLDAARAFNELSQMMPNATADQLQQAANDMFGGTNLLQGTNTRALFENLSSANRQRQQQAEQERALAEMERRVRMQGVLMQGVNQFATSIDDPVKAYDQFKQAYGPAASGVTPEMFSSVQQRSNLEFITQNKTLALEAARAGQDLKAIFPNASPSLLKSLEGMAKSEIEKTQERERQAAELRELELYTRLGDRYKPSADAPPDVASRITAMQSEDRQRRERESIASLSDTLSGSAPLITLLQQGDENGARTTVTDRAALALGRPPSAAELEQIMSSLRAVASFQQSSRAEALAKEVDARAVSDASARAEMARKQTLGIIENRATRDEVFGKDQAGTQLAETLKTMLQDEKITISSSQLLDIVNTLKNDETLRNAELVTPDLIRQAMFKNPTISGYLSAGAPERVGLEARETARRAAGLFPAQTADSYFNSTISSIEPQFQRRATETRTRVNAIMADPNLSPEARASKLSGMAAALQQDRQSFAAELDARARSTTWQTNPWQRRFGDQDAARLMQAYDAALPTITDIINNAMQSVTTQAPAPARPGSSAAPAAPPTPPAAPSGPVTWDTGPRSSRELDSARALREQQDSAEAALAGKMRPDIAARLAEINTQLANPNLEPSQVAALLSERRQLTIAAKTPENPAAARRLRDLQMLLQPSSGISPTTRQRLLQEYNSIIQSMPQ